MAFQADATRTELAGLLEPEVINHTIERINHVHLTGELLR